jgi:hypothetical protein
MPDHDDIDDTDEAIHRKAKGAVKASTVKASARKVVPGKSKGPQFSQGENKPVLDADMQPLGDPSRLAEAADVTPGDEAE